jgi:hypothetical protein
MRELNPAPLVRAVEDLATLAAAINRAHAEGERLTHKGLEHFHRAGEALLQAKAQCGHGKWLKWLKENIRFSERQAQNYMRLAKSAVTADLEDEWRKIQGNAPTWDDAAADAAEPGAAAAGEVIVLGGGVTLIPAPAPEPAGAPWRPPPARATAAESEDEDGDEAEAEPEDEAEDEDEPAAEPAPPAAKPGRRSIAKAEEIVSEDVDRAESFRMWLLAHGRAATDWEQGLLREYALGVARALHVEHAADGYRLGFRDAVKLLSEHVKIPQELLDQLQAWWAYELWTWAARGGAESLPEFPQLPSAD